MATACWRFPEDYDEVACLSAHQRNMCLENRDSMGLLAAIFTRREVKARELMALPWTNINAQYANGNTPLILAVQGMSVMHAGRVPCRVLIKIHFQNLYKTSSITIQSILKKPLVCLFVHFPVHNFGRI